MSPLLMFSVAVLVTLAVGVAAFVYGYRVSARHSKNAPPFRFSDQVESMPGTPGLIGWLLPRPLKSIWGGLCLTASMIFLGFLCLVTVGGSSYSTVSGIAYKIGAMAVWGGMMFGLGSLCERMVRNHKLSAPSRTD